MQPDFVAINVGNTNISIALFSGAQVVGSFKVPLTLKHDAAIAEVFKRLSRSEPMRVRSGLASVNDAGSTTGQAIAFGCFGSDPVIVGTDVEIPMMNLCAHPETTGIDRLCNALALREHCGAPGIAIDAGTALTISVVSEAGEFIGGAIMPGLRLSLESLNSGTSRLPLVQASALPAVIGSDTAGAIASGVVHGLRGAVKHLIALNRVALGGREFSVIGTGGDASLLLEGVEGVDEIDPHLTLKGIRLACL